MIISSSFGSRRAALVLARRFGKQPSVGLSRRKCPIVRRRCEEGRHFMNGAGVVVDNKYGATNFLAGAAVAFLSVTTTTAYLYQQNIQLWNNDEKNVSMGFESHKKKGETKSWFRNSSESTSQCGLYEKYHVHWNLPPLGRGSFGTVHLAHLVDSGEAVALKRIHKHRTDVTAFDKEKLALLLIQKHDAEGRKHIMKLRDVYQDKEYFYMVCDLALGGEVFDDLIENGPYTEQEAARLIHQLASGLQFLHNHVGLVHADLKPENLLLKNKNSRSHVVLADFGCAELQRDLFKNSTSCCSCCSSSKNDVSLLPEVETSLLAPNTSSGGTMAYWPPERFEKATNVTPATDMWSLGVILYILLTCFHPFDVDGTATDEDIQNRVCALRQNQHSPTVVAHGVSAGAQDVIASLMALEPQERVTAADLLHHPWILQHCSPPQQNVNHIAVTKENVIASAEVLLNAPSSAVVA